MDGYRLGLDLARSPLSRRSLAHFRSGVAVEDRRPRSGAPQVRPRRRRRSGPLAMIGPMPGGPPRLAAAFARSRSRWEQELHRESLADTASPTRQPADRGPASEVRQNPNDVVSRAIGLVAGNLGILCAVRDERSHWMPCMSSARNARGGCAGHAGGAHIIAEGLYSPRVPSRDACSISGLDHCCIPSYRVVRCEVCRLTGRNLRVYLVTTLEHQGEFGSVGRRPV